MSNLGDVLRQVVCTPKHIPDDWQFYKLTDICNPKQWKTISATEMTESGYPVFGANGFVGFYHEYNHENEAVAITCRGNTCGTINRIPSKTYITGNSMALDDIKKNVITQDFLYYALKYRGVGDSISGSAQPQITGAGLRSVEFPAPPLPEQQKIATILSSVDDVIEKTRAQIDKLKDLKTGMMQELLTKGVGHTEFKDSAVGRIPVSWQITKVGEVSKVKRGASPRPIQDPKWWGGKVGWVRISDVTSSRKYLTKTTQYLSGAGVSKSVQIPKGEVVLSICATIGRPIIVKVDACIHDGFVWFEKLRDSIDREFWYYFLASKEELLSSQRQSGTQGNLNTSIVSELDLPLPPQHEQEKIAAIMASIDIKIEKMLTKLSKLENQKKALMQDLLTGKVRVNLTDKESAVV